MRRTLKWLGSAALWLGAASAAPACVVRDTGPVNPGYGYGYGYGYGSGYTAAAVTVGQPSPFQVSSMPPEPLYEQMTPSPGFGHVWIDGYWHWNSYEWVWVGGRWERERVGLVYVQPYYDYSRGAFVYTPGYWAGRDRVPRGWQVRYRRDGRPPIVRPPVRGAPPVRVAPPPRRR